MQVYSTGKAYQHVEIMLKSMYQHDPRYTNSVFILGYNVIKGGIQYVHQLYPNQEIITMQLEQMYRGSMWVTKTNIEFLQQSHQVWDYDANNIDFLYNDFQVKCKFFPMQYVPELNRKPLLPPEEHDIDILFYGSFNERRNGIISMIEHELPNANFVTTDSLWDDELDDTIQRSKIILNLHYFIGSRQEQVRLSYLMCNHKCIVSERSIQNYYQKGIIEVDSKYLAKVCGDLLKNGAWYRFAKESLRTLILSNEHYTKMNGRAAAK